MRQNPQNVKSQCMQIEERNTHPHTRRSNVILTQIHFRLRLHTCDEEVFSYRNYDFNLRLFKETLPNKKQTHRMILIIFLYICARVSVCMCVSSSSDLSTIEVSFHFAHKMFEYACISYKIHSPYISITLSLHKCCCLVFALNYLSSVVASTLDLKQFFLFLP